MRCLEISALFGKFIDNTVAQCDTGKPQQLSLHLFRDTAHHDAGNTKERHVVIFNAQLLGKVRAVVLFEICHEMHEIRNRNKLTALPDFFRGVRHL